MIYFEIDATINNVNINDNTKNNIIDIIVIATECLNIVPPFFLHFSNNSWYELVFDLYFLIFFSICFLYKGINKKTQRKLYISDEYTPKIIDVTKDDFMEYKRLKNLREDNDKMQKELAIYLNITQQQYSLYERGIREIPIDLLIKLADFYNVSIDYILERTNNKKIY